MTAPTTAPKFVALIDGAEVGRYAHRASATRAIRKATDGQAAEVVTVEEFDARQAEAAKSAKAAERAAKREERAARLAAATADAADARGPVVAGKQSGAKARARVRVQAPATDGERAPRTGYSWNPASRGLNVEQKRALGVVYAQGARDAVRAAIDAGVFGEGDGEAFMAQANHWLSYLPQPREV